MSNLRNNFFPRLILVTLFLFFATVGHTTEKDPINSDIKEITTRDSSSLKDEVLDSKTNIAGKKIKLNAFDYGSLIIPFTTLISFLGSALLIIWQMGRQHKNSLKLQQENFRAELRLQIYKEIGQKISDASEKILKVGNMVQAIGLSFDTYFQVLSLGITPSPIPDREKRIQSAHFEALNSITQLKRKMEEYEIVNPNLSIFRSALSASHYDILIKFGPLLSNVLWYLPRDIPKEKQQLGKEVIIPKLPDKEGLKKIKTITAEYYDLTLDAATYIHDLAREAQNTLLGELFDHRIPKREPIDPKQIVITTDPDNKERIEKYFREQTNWGKVKRDTENRVKESLGKQ